MSSNISLIEKILDKLTGPFGALIISLIALWWLASKFELFVAQSMESHKEDRRVYEESMQKMSDQLVINSDKIDSIQKDVKDLTDDVKELKGNNNGSHTR
jgi:DNA-binding LacI/PurR family transcriptional regulator